ncbi:hypothetical protein [Streptomyces sp. MA5143a]|uniref:hypothetical protein n=1 Tax=Streptomyces sp. MA5143a TaxID=2083010 RepID=UPI0015E66CAB|nr:hypothetical protein [Streptomyces sp. MA5143a]
MKPIPDDVPAERAELAQALRDLLQQSVPEDVPADAIARAAGIGRSTLFHALSGQRVPSFDTVLTFVNACEGVRTQPDIVGRTADGSVFIAEAKTYEMPEETLEAWKRAWERARHPEAPRISYLTSHGTAEPEQSRSSRRGGRGSLGLHRSAVGDSAVYAERTTVLGQGRDADTGDNEVSVAEAQARLKRALEVLEDATRGVAHARTVLEKATKRERAAIFAKAEQHLAEAGADVKELRESFESFVLLWDDPARPPSDPGSEGDPGAAE